MKSALNEAPAVMGPGLEGGKIAHLGHLAADGLVIGAGIWIAWKAMQNLFGRSR